MAQICNECGGAVRLIDGEMVCGRCGLVYEEHAIDFGPDWRSADEIHDRRHNGPASSFMSVDKGLSTEIAYQDRDATGHAISRSNASSMRRLRKIHMRSRLNNGTKKSLATAIKDISQICGALSLPESIQEDIAAEYRRFIYKNGLRGRSVKITVAALTYAVCKLQGIARTLDEVSVAAAVDRKNLAKTYREISRIMKFNIHPTDPYEYVERFCSKLDLPIDVAWTARGILRENSQSFIGKSPVSLAASAIYMAAESNNTHRSQRDVARATGITEMTIRKISRAMSGVARA